MSNPSTEPVCVFCGSSSGSSEVYAVATRSVGKAIADAGRMLVYGGGSRGLMGLVSSTALQNGGITYGIIPLALTGRRVEDAVLKSRGNDGRACGVSKEGTGAEMLNGDYDGRLRTEVVSSMHDRKARMAELSTGGFIVLPGGFGTFEEVLEMVTWNQLRIHRRPVVVLNVNNFYTPLRTQIDVAVSEGFIQPINLSLLKIVDLQEGDGHEDWGKRCMEALEDWKWEEKAGYDLDWQNKKAIEA